MHPSRAGYRTATLCSVDESKTLSNYHRVTDVPAAVVYETIGRSVDLTEAIVRDLAPA